MKKYASLFAVLFVGFIFGLTVLSVAADWTNAPSNPPNDNAAAPLNIGSISQNKLGGLTINTKNPQDPTGLGVFGISKFFGNVEIGTTDLPAKLKIIDGSQGAGKVLMDVEGNGIATWIDIESVNPGVSSCVEVYDSTGALGGKPYYTSIDVPAVCISDTGTGCIIKQEIFRGTSIIRTRYFDYVQDPTSGFWQSSHNRTGKAKNGDSTSLNVITVFGSEDNGYLLLRDDRVAFSTTGYSYPGEISSTKWSAYDRRGNVDGVGESAHKLYVCSVSGATENDTP